MARTSGSGALSVEIQQEIFRAHSARKDSTVPALAKKHNVSKSIIKGVLYRLRKRTRVVLESPVPRETSSGESDARQTREP